MKKLKIFSVLLLLASTGAFLMFQAYFKVVQDRKPPVITCESDTLTLDVGADEKALLQGVTAKDSRSGDVTASIVVERISASTEENERIITYAAVDKSMNVGRAERTLVYQNYEPPVFHMNGSLCYSVGETLDLLSKVSVESTLDGDLTDKVKYSLEKVVNTQTAGEYPVEFRVTDSGGKTVYLKTQISVSEKNYTGADIKLSDYLIYVKKGAKFSPKKYYEGAQADGELKIRSHVDTKKAGTYYVDYILEGPGVSGKSRLVVVVE